MSERERQIIPILGINTAEPCHAVAEGAMEDIYNLRFKNSAFSNVCEPEILHPVTDDGGYTIVHKMECLADNEYIAINQASLTETKVAYVAILDGVITVKSVFASLGGASLTFHSFGNVLYINWGAGLELQEHSYMFRQGVFSIIDLGGIDPPTFKIKIESLYLGSYSAGRDYSMGVLNVKDGVKNFYYNAGMQRVKDKGFVVGAYYLALGYKLEDGSIIKLSNPIYIGSTIGRLSLDPRGESLIYSADNATGIKTSINCDISQEIKSEKLIKSIVVITSKVNVLHDFNKIRENFGKYGVSGLGDIHYCGANCILNEDALDLDQPLYELCEIDFRNENSVVINYEKINDVEHNPIYKPSYSNHKTVGRGKFEYNNRLHLFDLKTILFNQITQERISVRYGFANNWKPDDSLDGGYVESTPAEACVKLVVKIDNVEHTLTRSFSAQTYTHETKSGIFLSVRNLVTYPDARVVDIKLYARVWEQQQSGLAGHYVVYTFSHNMIKSFVNNLGYCFVEPIDYAGSNVYCNGYIPLTSGSVGQDNMPADDFLDKCFTQNNKLQVSAMNNPFYFDPVNIYTIGNTGCSIQAINTAAEQITETKFGMFPLYVFTDKAITALEVGSGEILYSRLIDVSGERKLPHTGTVGAKNLVFFISARGVMAIEGRAVQCISEPLDKYAGLTALEFSKYCADAGLSYNPIEEELLCYNPSFEYAYIYSLQGKFWSRRDWSARNIGTQSESFINSKGIASAWTEDQAKPLVKCKLKSRALKLGSLEFKRLETLVARLSVGSRSNYSIVVEGSNDLQSWIQLNSAQDCTLIRRTGASCKYFRISLTCNARDYFTITNFEAEYYLRFVRRLK